MQSLLGQHIYRMNSIVWNNLETKPRKPGPG